MVYDTDVHIPGQVEFLLMSFDNRNVEGIGQSLDSLLELEKDTGFKTDIKSYENDYNSKVKAIGDAAVKRLNGVKTIDDGIRILDEYHSEVNLLYGDYLKIIKTYIIGYFKKVE